MMASIVPESITPGLDRQAWIELCVAGSAAKPGCPTNRTLSIWDEVGDARIQPRTSSKTWCWVLGTPCLGHSHTHWPSPPQYGMTKRDRTHKFPRQSVRLARQRREKSGQPPSQTTPFTPTGTPGKRKLPKTQEGSFAISSFRSKLSARMPPCYNRPRPTSSVVPSSNPKRSLR